MGLNVSIVIPTYNRDECIIKLIHCLANQDYDDFEVLVIDQSETIGDEKRRIIAKYPKLRYFQIQEQGRSIAKNYGILFATGRIIIFCDDDIIVPRNFISTHVQTYNDTSIGALSCRLVEEGQPSIPIARPLRTTFFGRLINKAYSTKSDFVTSLNGGNMSFRKEVLDKVGFFEEHFIGTSMVEEPDMAYRVLKRGYRLYFNASITVHHYPQHNGNIAEFMKKRAIWFYNYFFNLSIFFIKYSRFWNMIAVLAYCVVLSIKHTMISRLGPRAYVRMVRGYFDGLIFGVRFSRNPMNRYYTPFRHPKDKYQIISKS